MSVVCCFCGAFFALPDGDVGQCPYCDEPAVLPHVTDAQAAQMEQEVSALIEAHSLPQQEV